MKTNYTPGPWGYHIGRGSNPRLHIQAKGGYQIASTPELGDYKPEAEAREANARLISASPDLLEDLQYAVETFELIAKLQKQGNTVDITDVVNRFKSTINKATGI